jgi:hypothetical protein
VLAALLGHFVYFVHGHRSLETWLVWHFLAIWVTSLVLSAANLGFDATWKHLTLAEHSARAGRVEPLLEGWYPGTAPHLPGFLYTWASLAPWGDVFDQIELAAAVGPGLDLRSVHRRRGPLWGLFACVPWASCAGSSCTLRTGTCRRSCP